MVYLIWPRKASSGASDKPCPDGGPFVRLSTEVHKNHPRTWAKYPKDREGWQGIIEMEHKELVDAFNAKDTDSYRENLVHLATACMEAWDA